MTHLLWGLLNIALFLFFIFICFRGTKLIREKLGLLASLVFVFGLLSFIGKPNIPNYGANTNSIKNWQLNTEDNLTKNSTNGIDVSLEKTLISKYDLTVIYGEDKETKLNVPIKAYSTTTGFISGINWVPTSIVVTNTENSNKFKFHVQGTVEWKLLGATIYSQLKLYNGFITTKNN